MAVSLKENFHEEDSIYSIEINEKEDMEIGWAANDKLTANSYILSVSEEKLADEDQR
jgi:hypothetical protein